MGRNKELLMERQENEILATQFLVSIGTLEKCEIHDMVYDGDGDLDRVWPIAMGEKKKGSSGQVSWGANMQTREFTDILKQAYEQNCGEECYLCEKLARE